MLAFCQANKKFVALAALCAQNSALILSMRYSRSVLHDSYLDSTIVLIMELTKLVISSALVWKDGAHIGHFAWLARHSMAIAVPSFLYVVQNSLQLMAVQNLDASTFSVLSQAKVLTTAVCSVLILRTQLSLRKWRALLLLVGGCVLVQYRPPVTTALSAEAAAAATAEAASMTLGLVCTAAMVTLSGVAGVLIERALKNQGSSKSLSLWERNVQLSLWGVLFASMSLLARDSAVVSERGFFSGWSPFAVIVVLCQSVGGLVTAVVVKYTDTIIKGFAVGLSVVITSILAHFLFHTDLTLLFGLGAGAVLLSIFNFNEADAPAASSSSAYVPSAEAKKQAGSPGTPFVPPRDDYREVESSERISLLMQQDRPVNDAGDSDSSSHIAMNVLSLPKPAVSKLS